ncbi:TRAP transporter small permease [Halobacillus amylolyticus]|uniref:TRAP transporter small permease n=1 Tax=Halobacillus amylolyticus TaxID=2932259 RepID=A0ABY4H913_9BACI|nr:TRAP transporter small permease [Halobacillus amylolyticus]UOR11363.1 TRAP transporter small permease [Halobacillus amylolyticus]
MRRLLDWSEKSVSFLTIILFIAMTIMVFTQVVLRFVFDSSIIWAEEFSRYAMVWLAFLGATIGIRHEEHTRIDFFLKLLPKKLKKLMEIVNKILCVIFLGVITYYSIIMFESTFSLLTPAMKIPIGLVHSILPATGIIMIVYILIQIVDIIKFEKEGDQTV